MRILQIGTYPIQPRTHGGQRRVGAILDGYRRHGIDAQYVPFFVADNYPTGRNGSAILAGPQTLAKIARQPLFEDLILGEGLDDDSEACAQFLKLYRECRPDALQFEQPFLWAAVKRLRESGFLPLTPVIYSSQNVECRMKEEIYARSLPPAEREPALLRLRALEEDLSQHAQLVIAVTEADARRFREMGARHCVVVRNGHDRRQPSPAAVARWREQLFDGWLRGYAFFVSSYHQPNFYGFDELVGPSLGYIPPDGRIIVAGGVTGLLSQHERYSSASPVNGSRLHLITGAVSDDDMAALLHLARAILLPITSGGGSNLKTVEALFSGRPIVASSYAFRGYEECASLPRVHLCDSPAEFHASVQRLLTQPLAPAEPAQETWDDALDRLTWPALTDSLVPQVRAALEPAQLCASNA